MDDVRSGGAFPIAPLWQRAIASGRVSGEVFAGRWFDVGARQRLDEADMAVAASPGAH